ncbi:hypothetical protein Daus18300_005042 [Diaporthe australafricana]|uniref:Rhodopsin domain-containing protein n=1 Tax=Diaporthe australafricana TaxID=127596 RepID=A0ABR3X481_9PEZI
MSDGYTDVPFEDLIPPPAQVDDTHRGTSVAAAIIVLGILTHIVVIARLCQRYASRNMGADDYAIILVLPLYLGWTAMAAFFYLHSGLGKQIGDITYGEFIMFFKETFAAAWIYPAMTAAIRVSVILFYRRIFARGNKFYSLFISSMLVLQAAYVVVFEITPGFSCRPIWDGWDPILRLTSCNSFYIYQTEALYSVSLVFDVVLLVFPIYAVWKLQMPLKKRLGVAVILALGAV